MKQHEREEVYRRRPDMKGTMNELITNVKAAKEIIKKLGKIEQTPDVAHVFNRMNAQVEVMNGQYEQLRMSWLSLLGLLPCLCSERTCVRVCVLFCASIANDQTTIGTWFTAIYTKHN